MIPTRNDMYVKEGVLHVSANDFFKFIDYRIQNMGKPWEVVSWTPSNQSSEHSVGQPDQFFSMEELDLGKPADLSGIEKRMAGVFENAVMSVIREENYMGTQSPNLFVFGERSLDAIEKEIDRSGP